MAKKIRTCPRKSGLTLRQTLIHLEACEDALTWAKGYTSRQKAWDECPNGYWMVWLGYDCVEPDRTTIIKAAGVVTAVAARLAPAGSAAAAARLAMAVAIRKACPKAPKLRKLS
jgi:hypothetical protein